MNYMNTTVFHALYTKYMWVCYTHIYLCIFCLSAIFGSYDTLLWIDIDIDQISWQLMRTLVNYKASYYINHGSYYLLVRSRCPLKHSCFQMYHHWNLIGWYPQVRGGRCSVALLDSLALSSIGGGICSCSRHKASGFTCQLQVFQHAALLPRAQGN